MPIKPLTTSHLCGGMANINVGPNETPFDAHMELICDCSSYFNAAYQERWTEDATWEPVCLPDDDPDVFTEFLVWVYRRKIYEGETPTWMQLCRLWILAQKLGAPGLQNKVMWLCRRKLRDYDKETMPRNVVAYVYDKTSEGSPLRMMIAEVLFWRAGKRGIAPMKKGLPPIIFEDICSLWFEYREKKGEEPDWASHCEGWHSVPEKGEESDYNEPAGAPDRPNQSSKPQTASTEQRANRKFKQPVKASANRSASPSTPIYTPVTTDEA